MYPAFLSFEPFYHPVKNIRLFFRYVKWSWQRIKRGYSDYDVDELHKWFQCIVPDMLLALRKQFDKPDGGYPAGMAEEFFEAHKGEIRLSYEEYQKSAFTPLWKKWDAQMYADCSKRWRDRIDEMRFLFLESDEDTCTKQNPHSPAEERTAWRNTEDELREYRTECRKKAFALFCQWFEYLWY